MYKIFISLLLITVLAVAAEDTYIFEAKGAFAKDLKALIEKYSKDGKIEAKVYKKDTSIIGSILNRGTQNLNGKNIYLKRCASCHGKNGETGAGAGSRLLKNMTKDEMTSSIFKYQTDEHYGGSMKMLMNNNIIGLGENKVVAIYNYLHGEEKDLKSSKKIENSNTEKSSYLQ